MAEKKTKRRRWAIQLTAALAANPFLLNFFGGKLYRGSLKQVCVPGLNCYSCSRSGRFLPIGSLQAVIGSPKYHISYYVFGILILFGNPF